VSGTRAIQLVEAGLWLRMSGDLDGARRLFEQALRLDPACERARELLGTKPAAAEELPEELQHIPSSATNLFAVPLPRLFPEAPVPPVEGPEAPTDPFIPMSLVPPLPPSYAPTTPPRPLPSMSAATPLPPPQRTPLPAGPPTAPRRPEGTPLPGLPPPRGTPAPAASPTSAGRTPPAGKAAKGGSQKTPLPAVPPWRGTPLPGPLPSTQRTPLPEPRTPPPARPAPPPSVPPVSASRPQGFARGGGPAGPPASGATPSPAVVPLPEPMQRAGMVVPREPPTSDSDDWWTDGVSTPAAPKDAWEVGRPRPTTLPPSETTEDDALHMVAPLPANAGGTPLPVQMPSDPRREAQMLLQHATELQELDDHSGARELLLQAQALDPEAPEVARALAESEQTLQALYESKLGKLSTVPHIRLRDDEVIWLNLDHRAGFILAQIDGSLSFDDLFSVSGMSRLDTARILVQLLEQRVIVR
jgi:hypothetical protein